ncbi:hypothetical protein EXS72_01900 [Candidatus Pacearchaeota archaeon]|nr:hypothetical protein [Candidatus Pacearchaeota archaeon]
MKNRYGIFKEILGERGFIPSEVSRIIGGIEGIGTRSPSAGRIEAYARKNGLLVGINMVDEHFDYSVPNLIRESNVVKIARGLGVPVNDNILEEALRNRGNE